MIERINLCSVNTKGSQPQKSQPQFKGLVDGLVKTVQVFEQNPMANVTFLDVTTAIAPRTIYESQTNAFAGFEAFRREASGLVVNCLIPSVLVLGAAKLVQKPIMGPNSSMASSWANEDVIKTVAKYWQAADGEGEVKIKNTFTNLINDIEGIDGDKKVSFKDFNHDESIKKLTDATVNPTKYSKKQIKNACNLISEKTLVSEHLKTVGTTHKYSGSLNSIIGEAPGVLKEFVKKDFVKPNQSVEEAVSAFVKKSTKLVNTKSLLGLGLTISLAISMQPINRWITAKSSGKKGAPIYKDFSNSKQVELTPKQKTELFGQKILSVAAMVGVALVSVMKKPNMAMVKEITQFKGIFPTMDQARLISTATFASRMVVSEDKNDLREATVRDIATFGAFYFVGDYVAKGLATVIQKVKPEHKLINVLKKSGENDNSLKKIWHWATQTSLKSSDEIASVATKKMRSLCQLGNINFSLVLLGVLIPMMTRRKTDKQHEEALKKAGIDKGRLEKKYPPPFMMNGSNLASNDHVFKAFFTAKHK